MRRIVSVILIAAVHGLLTKGLVALAMVTGMPAGQGAEMPTLITHIFVAATKVLYFPIITLSLYSRQWFPGNLVAIPMMVNSLLWGVAIYSLWALIRRRTSKRHP